jgi:hypothetical protein
MSSRRLAVLLGVALLIVLGPFVGPDTAQPASRYDLTASLAEHGSVDLGPYRHRLGVDRAVYRGHLRSDKAPGQPILAVPVYLAGRAVGADSAVHARENGDLGLWWVTLWSATVPFVILVALMFLAAERFVRRNVALAVALLIGLTTMMLPHSVNLFGHDLAALFGFGAWLLLERDAISPRRAALAGVLAGASVLTEYECVIILLVLAGYLLARHRSRIGWFALGASAPLAVLAWYQWAAFGAPWRTPSAYFAGTINGTTEGGYSVPGVRSLLAVLFGNRGLWVGAPVALLALAGAVWIVKTGSGVARRNAVVGVAVMLPFIVLVAGWSGFKLLEDPGPRFLIPALPFLAVPLAVVWDRVWRAALLLAAWGALIAVSATVTRLLIGIGQPVVPALPRRVIDGEFAPTLWSMAFGRTGIALYVVSVAVAAGLFARALRHPRPATEQMFASAASTQ